MNEIEPLKNEDGTILVISLIILALASMIGVAATMTASLEVQISGNDMHYAENFYKAEAAAMVGAQAIETTAPTKLDGGQYTSGDTDITLPELDRDGQSDELYGDDISCESNWEGQISADAPDAILNEGYQAKFLPVKKPPSGASLDQTASTQIHEFIIYGRSIQENPNSNKKLGEVIIEVGYRRRF